eukprot:8511178-Alexandrium_andersonii.AAC.1
METARNGLKQPRPKKLLVALLGGLAELRPALGPPRAARTGDEAARGGIKRSSGPSESARR